MNKEFTSVFQINKTITFEVNYYTMGSNKSPHFSTSANQFNRPKTDYNRCGQCQNDLLTGKAKRFYDKWDKLHLSILTENQYNEMIEDLEELKNTYNHIYTCLDKEIYKRSISFSDMKDLSMMKIK